MLKLFPVCPVEFGLVKLASVSYVHAPHHSLSTSCSLAQQHVAGLSCAIFCSSEISRLSSSYLHHYFYTFISISITTENHVWQSWKCASQISDCRKHNWLTVPAAMLRKPSLFQPRLCIPPAAPSQWLSTADILRQAYCWDLGPLWWATPAQGLLVSFAETPITAPQLRLFQLNFLFFPSSLFHKAKAYSTVWCAGSPSSSKSLSFPQSLACLVPSWHQFLRKPEPTYYEFTQIPHNTHNKIPIQQSAVHFSFLPLFIPPFSDYEKPGFHYL